MTDALLPTFNRVDLSFESGDGAWITTTDGRRFLDFGSGIAVNALGYNHPHLVAAMQAAINKPWHVSNLFRIPDGERLAERLVANTFAEKVFFCNSGAEANEAAIKMARKYHAVSGHPERFRIITFEGAFHGRTLATIAAGGQAKYLEGFGPKVDGFDQVPFGDHEAVKAAIGPETAAIMIEPIQGEGGIRPVPPQCLRGLRALCDEHGLLLIFDEIQCGVGRTGTFLAYEWAGIAPDIATLAKGIGGGFPLGACLSTAEAGKGMTAGTHGTTFGGNPLAMAAGNAVLDVVLAPGFLDQVKSAGLRLKQGLASLKDRYPEVIEAVRGEGLMLGLKARHSNLALAQAMRDEGLLGVPAGDNVLRLMPPLIVSEDNISQALVKLEAACRTVSASGKTAAE